MQDQGRLYKKDILILNQPYVIFEEGFCFQLFRIPEILNRLKQYREVLNKQGVNVPLWVYNLIQDLKISTEGYQPFALKFLINLGFFDRYISYKGWPQYVIGSEPWMSVLVGEVSFEEQALLLSQGYSQSGSKLQLYKVSSYYNKQTGSFCLNSLTKLKTGHTMEEFLEYLKISLKTDWESYFFQLLSPHDMEFIHELQYKGVFPKDFLESDSSLNWLWPLWKKIQLRDLNKRLSQTHPLS